MLCGGSSVLANLIAARFEVEAYYAFSWDSETIDVLCRTLLIRRCPKLLTPQNTMK